MGSMKRWPFHSLIYVDSQKTNEGALLKISFKLNLSLSKLGMFQKTYFFKGAPNKNPLSFKSFWYLMLD